MGKVEGVKIGSDEEKLAGRVELMSCYKGWSAGINGVRREKEQMTERGRAATQDFEQEQTEKTERKNFAKNALYLDLAPQKGRDFFMAKGRDYAVLRGFSRCGEASPSRFKVLGSLSAPMGAQPCDAGGVRLTLQLMASPLDPDAALMLRVKDGDVQAFELLVEKYKHPIVNVIYRMLHDLDEAEDLAQNVFIRVFQSAGRYEVSAKFSTWIFTIARHLCLNEIRRRGRHPAQSLDSSQSDDPEQAPRQYPDGKTFSPPEAFLHGELEQKIRQALDELPDKQRLAIELCQQDELSYEEIALVLGCSVSATKSLIHRGRETLKEKLKPYLRTGAWEEPESETLPEKRCS